MKSAIQSLQQQLLGLKKLLLNLNDASYTFSSAWLSGSTVGQHSRHVIELVQCLANDYEKGTVCYDKRKRDKLTETTVQYAVSSIDDLITRLPVTDKLMNLEAILDAGEGKSSMIHTTYQRELVYNIEHAVHHLALIKVALKEMNIEPGDENIGVAYATIQYRKACAQ
jgi:hypothetical protein